VTVRDEPDAIVHEIQEALSEKISLIVTGGGLGPTPDDLTLSAIAQAVNSQLVLNFSAQALVSERIQQLHAAGLIRDGRMTPSREKMAWLPERAEPLVNHVGTAPGALLRLAQTTIVCLPGVPAELKDIFSNALQPHLNSLFSASSYLEKELILSWNDESALAPMLEAVRQKWPHVYVKSRARSFEQGFRVLLTLSMSGPHATDLEELDDVEAYLQEELSRKGIAFSRR
jgi:molybdopterin-biosynthesis enzyme MoeA-like protein